MGWICEVEDCVVFGKEMLNLMPLVSIVDVSNEIVDGVSNGSI